MAGSRRGGKKKGKGLGFETFRSFKIIRVNGYIDPTAGSNGLSPVQKLIGSRGQTGPEWWLGDPVPFLKRSVFTSK